MVEVRNAIDEYLLSVPCCIAVVFCEAGLVIPLFTLVGMMGGSISIDVSIAPEVLKVEPIEV